MGSRAPYTPPSICFSKHYGASLIAPSPALDSHLSSQRVPQGRVENRHNEEGLLVRVVQSPEGVLPPPSIAGAALPLRDHFEAVRAELHVGLPQRPPRDARRYSRFLLQVLRHAWRGRAQGHLQREGGLSDYIITSLPVEPCLWVSRVYRSQSFARFSRFFQLHFIACFSAVRLLDTNRHLVLPAVRVTTSSSL